MSRELTTEEVEAAGFKALLDALGPVDAIRFIQRCEGGRGDYTKERKAWLKDLTIDDFIREARQERGD